MKSAHNDGDDDDMPHEHDMTDQSKCHSAQLIHGSGSGSNSSSGSKCFRVVIHWIVSVGRVFPTNTLYCLS